jgi:sulfopyruvate decarboxylase subunit alpha
MYDGPEIHQRLVAMGITHVVWIPDSTFGEWDEVFSNSDQLQLIQVCREGEAWAVAAGLYLGGARPLVIIQCTGLFESGDSLRNTMHDYGLPLFGIVGYRSYLNSSSLPGDTCLKFTEPVLAAWDVATAFVDEAAKKSQLEELYQECQQQGKPGILLMAEGRA